MKSIMKIATFLFVLLTANAAFAGTDKPVFKLKNLGEKTIYFETKEMSSSYVEVMFQDENGNTIFSEYAIHTANFERNYNLSELANGSYFLIVKSESTTQTLPITISEEGLEMDWEDLGSM